MTPQQKLKHAILLKALAFKYIEDQGEINSDNVDELYELNDQDWELQDAKNEVRCSGIETGLDCEYSRHYESEAVAAQMTDGTWVGWTYWYGGGKHSDPDSIDWIGDAYDLECTEKQVMQTVREFKKK